MLTLFAHLRMIGFVLKDRYVCSQVAVGSLRVSQRGVDAHENANRVSVHAEAVQRESNTHGQRSSLHLILLLQRASKTHCPS